MSLLRRVIFGISLVVATTGSAFAGAPLETDDASTVDVGKFEVSLSGSYTRDKEGTSKVTSHGAELGITTGLYKNLGISVALPYTFSSREKDSGVLVSKDDGFGDMSLDLKYVFAEVSGVNLAIRPGVVLPSGKSSLTEDHVQYTAALITTREFNDGPMLCMPILAMNFTPIKTAMKGCVATSGQPRLPERRKP